MAGGGLFAISKSTGFNYISVWLKTEKEIEKLKVKRNKIIFFGVKNIIPVWLFLGSILVISLE